jgi:hypothetical protein
MLCSTKFLECDGWQCDPQIKFKTTTIKIGNVSYEKSSFIKNEIECHSRVDRLVNALVINVKILSRF